MPTLRTASLPLAIAFVFAVALPAGAESQLSLPLPDLFGEIEANTYNEKGTRVGDALIRLERLDDGLVELEATSGIDGAEQTIVTAKLAPVEGEAALRPVHQSSRSFDAAGLPLGLMTIDHDRGEVVCTPPMASGKPAERMDLPDGDRVANVPLNLLFLPLVRGQESKVEFQIVLCRGGPRLVKATAKVAKHRKSNGNGNGHLVEVRYDLDLGPVLSRLARPFIPKISFWFDAEAAGAWVAHRMPLFSKGPTVLVVRSGFTPAVLGFP